MSEPGADLGRLVDAAVHPVPHDLDVLRGYLEPQWRERALPGPERYQYLAPGGDNWEQAQRDSGIPGSDLANLIDLVLDQRRVTAAVLVPPGLGLLPDPRHGTAVAAAINRWLAEEVLGRPEADGRLFGSIRVDPRDPTAALTEIRCWADHPAMVQVVLPLQAHHPYGTEAFFPIWAEAAQRGLPVAMRLDVGGSVEFHPSAAGGLRCAIDYDVLAPLNYAFHLGSLVAEGVFERLPDLRVVVTDGGWPTSPGFAWRLDKDWRPNRAFLPRMRRLPSHYLREQVVFCLDHLDLPPSPEPVRAWSGIAGGGCGLMYASHYPRWGAAYALEDLARVPADRRGAVAGELAIELYQLEKRGFRTEAA